MNKLQSCVILLNILFGVKSIASDEAKFKGQCAEIVKMIEKINKEVNSSKQVQVRNCEETYEKGLFGIKKNFRSKVSLGSEFPLCVEAEYVERSMTTFENPVDLGLKYEEKVRVLQHFGIERGPIMTSGGITGYYLTGIHYPICSSISK